MMSSTSLVLGPMTAPIGFPGAPLVTGVGAMVPDFARALTDLMTGTAPAALAQAVSVARQDVAVVGKNLPIVERVPSPDFKNRPVCELLDPGALSALPSSGATQIAERAIAPIDPDDPQQEPALAWLMPPLPGPAPVIRPAADCEMPTDLPEPVDRAPAIVDSAPTPRIASDIPDCEMPVGLPESAPPQPGAELASLERQSLSDLSSQSTNDVSPGNEVPIADDADSSRTVPTTDTVPTARRLAQAAPDIFVLQTPVPKGAVAAPLIGAVTVPAPPTDGATRLPAGPKALSGGVRREPVTALSEERLRATAAKRLEIQTITLPVRDSGATLAAAAAVRAVPVVAAGVEPVSSLANATSALDAGPFAPIAAGAPAAAPVSAPQQPGIDLTRDPGLHQMIDRIEHLRDTFDVRETRIRLIPDALGPVDIAVRRDSASDAVQVHFTAAEASTRQLIAEAQQRLVEFADARGVRIERATIDGGAVSSQPWSNGEGQPRQQQQGHAPQPRAPARAGRDSESQTPEDRIA